MLAETVARQQAAAIAGSTHARRAAVLATSNPGLDPGHPDITEAAAYPETVKKAAAILSTPGRTPAGPE